MRLALGLVAASLAWQAAAAATYADVAPVLQQRCVMCHAGPSAPAGLRLDSLDAVRAGSARGPVVRAGDPAGSELMRRLTGRSLPRMPLTGPPFLADAEVALFERWIAAGLPPGTPAPAAPAAAGPAPRRAGDPVTWQDVAPLLASRCAKCHAAQGLMGPAPEGLRLTSHADTLDATDRARVVPGRPEASELVRRLRGQSLPRMPLDGPPHLADDDIRLIETWIAQGARDAQGRPAAMPAGARVRLGGTLTAPARLDTLPLGIGPGTRVDKAPAPGQRAEVRGRLDAEGNVQVDRLRRQ